MDVAAKQSRQWPSTVSPHELQEAIRHRAEEIYERSGKIQGRDAQNWAQAEAEIQREYHERSVRKAAIAVNVNGMRYVGEYSLGAADGYIPGEFASGDSIPIRLEGDRMYVKRPNGKELETRIISKSAKKMG